MNVKKLWTFDTSASVDEVMAAVHRAMTKRDLRGKWHFQQVDHDEFVYRFEQSALGTLGPLKHSGGAVIGFSLVGAGDGSILSMGIDSARRVGFAGMGVGGEPVFQSRFKAVRSAIRALDSSVVITKS